MLTLKMMFLCCWWLLWSPIFLELLKIISNFSFLYSSAASDNPLKLPCSINVLKSISFHVFYSSVIPYFFMFYCSLLLSLMCVTVFILFFWYWALFLCFDRTLIGILTTILFPIINIVWIWISLEMIFQWSTLSFEQVDLVDVFCSPCFFNY